MMPRAWRLHDPGSLCVRDLIDGSPNNVVLVGAARAPDDVVFITRRAPHDVRAFRSRTAAGPTDSLRTLIASAGRAQDDVVFLTGTPDDVITRRVRGPAASDNV